LDFYNANNTHVAKKAFTNNKICTKFSEYLNCAIKDSCTSSETCVASIAYETNSHVGDCNYYSHNICCGSLAINVEAGGPYVKTDSLPTILIAGNVTFGRESAPSANVSISIYEGTTLKASKETIASSSGKFFTTFTDLDVGTYTVNVSANYSLTNASTSDTFKVIQRLTGCTQKTVSLNGVALDYLTGSSISSGTVKITIKENGDEFSTTFTNGRWTIAFVSCLVSNDRYIATVQITDSSTGRTSWGEMQFIAP